MLRSGTWCVCKRLRSRTRCSVGAQNALAKEGSVTATAPALSMSAHGVSACAFVLDKAHMTLCAFGHVHNEWNSVVVGVCVVEAFFPAAGGVVLYSVCTVDGGGLQERISFIHLYGAHQKLGSPTASSSFHQCSQISLLLRAQLSVVKFSKRKTLSLMLASIPRCDPMFGVSLALALAWAVAHWTDLISRVVLVHEGNNCRDARCVCRGVS